MTDQDALIADLSIVALTRDLPAFGLRAGDVGTIVYGDPQKRGYLVEFTDENGKSIVEDRVVVELQRQDLSVLCE